MSPLGTMQLAISGCQCGRAAARYTYPPCSLRRTRRAFVFCSRAPDSSDGQVPKWITRAAVLPTAVGQARVAGLAEQFKHSKRMRG